MKWISVKEQPPPKGVRLFVIKHYMDQRFDPEAGGYRGESFPTPSGADIDISYREYGWENGGIVTHWMHIPEFPDGLG
jgi:hypothetical protein